MSTPAPKAALPARPLSPFMIGPYYKPQLTSMLSIVHRITGVGLAAGVMLMVAWLCAIAAGPEAYAKVAPCVNSIFGKLVLVAFTWALLYHFCNGIRHLMWDTGKGLDLPTAEKTGYAVMAGSVLLTAAVWGCALFVK